MADKFPVTERTDVLPSENPQHYKKKIGADWGATNEAGNDPNTPSMKTYKGKSSVNLYADYQKDTDANTNPDQDPFHNKITKD